MEQTIYLRKRISIDSFNPSSDYNYKNSGVLEAELLNIKFNYINRYMFRFSDPLFSTTRNNKKIESEFQTRVYKVNDDKTKTKTKTMTKGGGAVKRQQQQEQLR